MHFTFHDPFRQFATRLRAVRDHLNEFCVYKSQWCLLHQITVQGNSNKKPFSLLFFFLKFLREKATNVYTGCILASENNAD